MRYSFHDYEEYVAEGETALKQEALDALALINAEGSGAVFPEIDDEIGQR